MLFSFSCWIMISFFICHYDWFARLRVLLSIITSNHLINPDKELLSFPLKSQGILGESSMVDRCPFLFFLHFHIHKTLPKTCFHDWRRSSGLTTPYCPECTPSFSPANLKTPNLSPPLYGDPPFFIQTCFSLYVHIWRTTVQAQEVGSIKHLCCVISKLLLDF